MADRDDTLIVPVTVDALVVNQTLRQRDGQGFRRWQPNFNLLRHNLTPEPDPFTNDDAWNAPQDDPGQRDGVYVRWELPEALRRGASRTPGGRTEFPLVPNRWLVVRYVKDRPEHLAAWVVESDFLHPEDGTSRFVHPFKPGVRDVTVTPYRSTIITTKAGRALDTGPDGTEWREPADESRKELFLTAVGPGLMTFHAYQPYHENVFSFHDLLEGIDEEIVDYQVIGWYSDPAREELRRLLAAPDATVKGVLAGLGWTVDGLPQGWTPGSTTYCGRVAGVDWKRDGDAPDSDRPDKNKNSVTIAVGSSADEAHAALTALARATLPEGSGNALEHTDHALLHALGSGLTDTLDGPDGPVRTAQELHKGWFTQVPGGHVWRLADSTGQGNASGDPKSVTWSGAAPEHEQWLARLNSLQHDYDKKARELSYLQQRLYALWWMHGLPLIPRHYTRERFRAEIDPAGADGLAAKVAERKTELAELETALTAYTAGRPDGCELRRESLPPFWQVTDPSVVLSGTKDHAAPHAALSGSKDGLPCRMPGQITGGVTPGGELPAPFAALKAGGLPPVVPALLGEFLQLLDTKALPQWRQPWKPLLYQWQVRHWNVPYGDWEFDGTRYHWQSGEIAKDSYVETTGRRFLVPLPQHNLGGALEAHGATAAAEQATDLDLLSQKLDGLTDRLACRDKAPNLSPPGAIGDLVGDVRGHLPRTGQVPVPFEGWLPSGFAQIRAGQIAMAALSVVDEFGQTLDVLLPGDQDYLRPAVGDSLLPGEKRADQELKDRFVQLPPRLLQPARLRFDFVDERQDDKLVDLEAGTTPVCAWIIPSYVDRSLLCYAPDGTPLGEVRLKLRADAASPDGVTTVLGWDPLPDSSVRTLDDLGAARPQLYACLRELVAKGPDAFADLLSTVDRSLTGIDPGNPYGDEVLGALLGRPLALVRARLGFELDGPPIADPGWQYALDWRTPLVWEEAGTTGQPVPPQMDHLTYRWPVRLGNAGQQGDGLIGYFTETDYTQFHAVATPDTTTPTDYVSEIGEANWPRLAADSKQHTHLTLLLDPQAAVHATTDLLPVTDLRLPTRFTRNAMAAMKPALRLSPVLTTTRKLPADQAPAPAPLALPHPTSPQGTWDWAELTVPDAAAGDTPGPQWAHRSVVQIDQKARLDEDGPVVRTGFLRLTNPFDGGAAQ
ncbi:hypothetical protein [Streptomyces roseoverticillatus]|uniref:hypothetical protein n=1 Tax=Streptomyces roseoverticillatus TaxID=66429 RepID=UPI0004C0A5F8|nr:hypothetical protein [Streptomyces roseoverticillatus]